MSFQIANAMTEKPLKRPVSAIVLIHTRALECLLIERVDIADFWQSVTGSCEDGEAAIDTARREVWEETGIDARAHGDVVDWKMSNQFSIYPQFRHRYPAGTTHNTEHVFSLCVPRDVVVTLRPREHRAYIWLPWGEATLKVKSWTNQAVIDALPLRFSP
jgi:dihydroneopterin triphosphate diphosphatase